MVLVLILGGLAVHIPPARAEVRLGMEIPSDAPVVGLDTVIANPSEYDGKTIVMKGIISGQCASLCEFFFRDGMHTATIYPQGFKFPKLKKGKPVTLYTLVISGEENVVFSALGLFME
jgi:hypothetical protein